MYPQNKQMYPQFAGNDKGNCIHKIRKCGYKSKTIQQGKDKLLSYGVKRNWKRYCIGCFVDTTWIQHKTIDGGDLCES